MSDPRGPDTQWLGETVTEFADRIAKNFETRARQIATHNQRSHTSNTQQRKNMEIMHQLWSDAAAYVRAQAPK